MSCSQCYTAQVPECIENLFISAKIPGDDPIDIVIKITDSHGNVYLIDGFYLDGMVSVDIANSSLPKNLLNRYAGTMTIEVPRYDGVATMLICEKEYTCINVSMLINSLQESNYYIGCPPQ